MRQSQEELRRALARHNVPPELALIAKLTAIPASRLREFLAGATLDISEHMTLARYAMPETP